MTSAVPVPENGPASPQKVGAELAEMSPGGGVAAEVGRRQSEKDLEKTVEVVASIVDAASDESQKHGEKSNSEISVASWTRSHINAVADSGLFCSKRHL